MQIKRLYGHKSLSPGQRHPDLPRHPQAHRAGTRTYRQGPFGAPGLVVVPRRRPWRRAPGSATASGRSSHARSTTSRSRSGRSMRSRSTWENSGHEGPLDRLRPRRSPTRGRPNLGGGHRNRRSAQRDTASRPRRFRDGRRARTGSTWPPRPSASRPRTRRDGGARDRDLRRRPGRGGRRRLAGRGRARPRTPSPSSTGPCRGLTKSGDPNSSSGTRATTAHATSPADRSGIRGPASRHRRRAPACGKGYLVDPAGTDAASRCMVEVDAGPDGLVLKAGCGYTPPADGHALD